MAREPSSSIEMNGEYSKHRGRSKRLCTGFSNASEPGSAFQSQWADSQMLPEQSHGSYILEAQEWSSSAVDLDHVSQSRQLGGNVQGQSLFQSHQNELAPSSAYNSQSPWPELASTTSLTYKQPLSAPAPLHPVSNPSHHRNTPSSAITFQPTATFNIPHGENPPDRYHQPDAGAVSQFECQYSASDGTSRLQESGNTGDEDTSYELCLGLVSRVPLLYEIFRPQYPRCNT